MLFVRYFKRHSLLHKIQMTIIFSFIDASHITSHDDTSFLDTSRTFSADDSMWPNGFQRGDSFARYSSAVNSSRSISSSVDLTERQNSEQKTPVVRGKYKICLVLNNSYVRRLSDRIIRNRTGIMSQTYERSITNPNRNKDEKNYQNVATFRLHTTNCGNDLCVGLSTDMTIVILFLWLNG